MNKNPAKGNSNEENRKSKEDADKMPDEENTKNKGKAGKPGDKDGAVLGEINDN